MERAIRWAARYEADMARLEREREQAQRRPPMPAIY
jgi:hypothetical protein